LYNNAYITPPTRLDDDDHARESSEYGSSPETRPAPAARTHDETKRLALQADEYRGPKTQHPCHATGVKYLSGLYFVPQFNIIRDMNPDAMHIVSRLLSGRVMPLLKGQARPAAYTDLKPKIGESDKEERTREAHNKKMNKKRGKVVREVMLCELKKNELRTLDKRSTQLGGQTTFVRSGIKINQRTGALNAHDWLKILGPALQYILKGIGGNKDAIGAILGLMDVLKKVTEATSDMPWDEVEVDHDTPRLKRELILALARYELCVPQSEHTYMLHLSMHLPDAIHRWNSVRNFWAFFSERYILFVMYIIV
jgi:hypothetical protein